MMGTWVTSLSSSSLGKYTTVNQINQSITQIMNFLLGVHLSVHGETAFGFSRHFALRKEFIADVLCVKLLKKSPKDMQKKLNVMQDCQSFWPHTHTMTVRRARPIPHLLERVGGDHFFFPPLGTRRRDWPYVNTDDVFYHLGHAGHNGRSPWLSSFQTWTLSASR